MFVVLPSSFICLNQTSILCVCRLLADSLVILSRFLSAKPQSTQTTTENKAIEDSACKLVELLPPRCVEQSVHMLLQSLHTNDSGTVNKRMVSWEYFRLH